MSSTGGGDQPWHVSPSTLAAYASGHLEDVDAWSAEAHLTSCASCRSELAALVASAPNSTADARLLAHVRTQLLDDVAGTAGAGVGVVRRTRWHLDWVVRPSSLVAVVVAVLAAVAVAITTGRHVATPGAAHWLLWLMAPAVPVGGVALCSLDDRDGLHEAELATPSAGWRLVLWRTAAVVVTAVPLALVAGWLVTALPASWPGAVTHPGASDPWLAVLWLLPALALVVATLAVGTWVALPRAAAVIAAVWTLAVLAPVLLQARGRDAAQVWPLHLLSEAAQPFWVLLLAVGAVVVVARREAFGQTPTKTTRMTTKGTHA